MLSHALSSVIDDFEQSEINKSAFLEAGGERALHFT